MYKYERIDWAGTTKQSQPIFDIFFAFDVTFASIEINWQKYGIVNRHMVIIICLERITINFACFGYYLSSELRALIIVILHGKFNFIFIITNKVNKNTNDDETRIRTLNARLVRRKTKWIRWIEYFQIIKYWIWHFSAPVVSFANDTKQSS